MLTIVDPCELKPADVYRQARAVMSKTSRASDGNWYREPCEMACQWHLWFDGGREVCSATYSAVDHRWRPGPELPLASLTTAEEVNDLLGHLLSPEYFGQKPKALGVILHVADEFSLAEIKAGVDGFGEGIDDFKFLRYTLIDEPREVLADREVSVESTSWRLLPFWGAPVGHARCTAVALSRSREAFLTKLLACGEELRMPVRAAVTCAPVEALAALPLHGLQRTGGMLVVLPYLKFTAVFALTAEGELRGVRSLSHRGGALVPANFGDILWNTALGAELAGGRSGSTGRLRVLVASASPAALQAALSDLEVYAISRQTIECEGVDLTGVECLSEVPGHRPEFLAHSGAAVDKGRALAASDFGKAATFQALWNGWATQSFFDTARLDTMYPTRRDLRLLRFSSWFMYLLVFSLVGSAGYGTWSLMAAMNHPSWSLTPQQIKRTQEQHEKLLTEQKQIDITNRLMEPRSRGWVALEALLQLFPEEAGVRLDSFNYAVDAIRPPGVAKGKQAPDAVGLSRTWTLKGLAKAKALEVLSNLNSQRGLTAFFERVAEAAGDASYQPSPTRQFTITLTQGKNGKYDADAAPADVVREPALAFPFSFEATITQTFSDKDPLAVPVGNPF